LKIVTFETADRSGGPFKDVISKYGLPSKKFRHCTRELKEVPIHKYAKKVLGKDYLTAVGIRADEPHRLGKKPNYIYPLAEMGFTEEIIRRWWDKQDFNLELKDYQGNCDLCFLKSKRKRLTILSENPSISEWWQAMEETYGNDRQPIFDVRSNLSIQDLVEQSKVAFQKVEDKHELRSRQATMFDPDMDIEFDCFCKMT